MKRLVICADGTWNVRDQINDETGRPRPTNVTKVARAIRPRARDGVDQIVFYHDGVGTRGPLDKLTGGAFGDGMEANIRDLYRFIVYNYEPGDEIYLFGFSRGAFTVRSLAGFMAAVNLIEKDDDYYVPEIYACYESSAQVGSATWTKAFHNVKGTRPCPPIKFIGVWDTVGALGAPGMIGKTHNKYKYHATGLSPVIQNAFQALAIDERRRPFAPDVWQRPSGWQGKLEQAWFAGVHSNVGGSYYPDGLANEALHWIVEKAESLGLEFDSAYLEKFTPCFNARLHDSMTLKYRLLGPVTRPLGIHPDSGESLHQSVIDRMHHAESAYKPVNVGSDAQRLPTVTTVRIKRDQPCAPLPPRNPTS